MGKICLILIAAICVSQLSANVYVRLNKYSIILKKLNTYSYQSYSLLTLFRTLTETHVNVRIVQDQEVIKATQDLKDQKD